MVATMTRNGFRTLLLMTLGAGSLAGQTLSPKWEELTAPDFVKALELAKGTCVLPFGVIEKHGPAGPLGTDLINVRYATFQAVKDEYAIVFPEYYFGQIFEAKHQPGTIAYSTRLQLEMLQETTAEMGRNGCRKIAIVNGHGGNTNLLQFFSQSTLESAKDYVVYAVLNQPNPNPPEAARASKPGVDGHAGEAEISSVMASRPDLVHIDRSPSQSGRDLNRIDLPGSVYAGIWWYGKFPNHYQGDSAAASAARGQALVTLRAGVIASALRAIKSDETGPRLQKEFFDGAARPLTTKQ
jgi:creatinine amidohydrolase